MVSYLRSKPLIKICYFTLQVEFASQEEAIAFVEKNGWDYWVEKASEKQPKAKSYALNFAWNKRTRKSTK